MSGVARELSLLVERRMVSELVRLMQQWWAARLDWPPDVVWQTWEREAPLERDAAACRTAALLRRALNEAVGEERGRALFPAAEPPPRGPRMLTLQSALVCECAPPSHVRGIARCEWNALHGWRPKEVS